MRYDAVVFDLFGTLVDYLPGEEWMRAHKQIADLLGVGFDDFRAVWRECMPGRDLGRFSGVEGDIRRVASVLGLSWRFVI